MAVLPVQSLPMESGGVLFYWGPMNAGDEGEPVKMYAFPGLSWQLTGFAGYNSDGTYADPDTHPNIPAMFDRAAVIRGSNDPAPPRCFCPIFSFVPNANGMNTRTADPCHDGTNDQRFHFVKPICTGTVNPLGPDCGVLLMGYLLNAT